jgi:hypothetical protein
VFRNPADQGKLKEASFAAVDSEALLSSVEELCHVSKSNYEIEDVKKDCANDTKAPAQRIKITEFLGLYYENDSRVSDKVG